MKYKSDLDIIGDAYSKQLNEAFDMFDEQQENTTQSNIQNQSNAQNNNQNNDQNVNYSDTPQNEEPTIDSTIIDCILGSIDGILMQNNISEENQHQYLNEVINVLNDIINGGEPNDGVADETSPENNNAQSQPNEEEERKKGCCHNKSMKRKHCNC